jgi:hypothetical protein
MSDIENKEEQEKEQEEELVGGATDAEIAKDDKTEESED